MKKIIYLSIISFFLYAGKSEAQTILKGTIGSIGSVFKKKASNSNDSGKIPERVPVVGHYSLGIGMFNDVNENHPFSFDMYKFFQSNNILGPDSNYLNVKLTDRPGTTDYYMEGNIVYGYMDTCSWEFLPDIKKLERNYKKSWGNMYCNNLYYIFECKLYKGKELMEDFKDTMRRGIYDQKNNRYFFLFTAGGKGPTNKTTSNFLGVRMWSLDYLESVTYREVNKLLTGNNPKEELKPLKDVDETWNLKSSLIAHYNSAWEDMLQQIYDLKWESGGKADSKYILSKYIQINPAQYVSTLYGTGDNELFYNSSLTYPVLSDKLPATLKKMDKSNPSGFLPGVLTNYVPQDAIINDPILMKEHYIEAPELSQATADDIILQLPYFYENKQFGEEQSLSEFFYKYKSFDNFYWSNMTIMCGNHKRPGNCMTLLYIAKKFAADSDYNASDLVYKHVLQESNTLLTSSPVAKAFRYYAYKGMQSNADKQNHKLYSDLLSLIQATVSGYLISDASRLDEANYRDGMGKIINFVDTTAYNQRKMNKGKWLNVAKAVAGAAAANAGTITDAATGGETDATTAITNTATTLTNNMANTIDQNESMNENYYKIIAQANVSSKINAIQDVGDLDPNNRLAAQEILSFAQIDTTGAYVIPALEKYAADKPVLQGLVNDYKNALLGITAPKPTVSQPQNNDKGNAKGKKSHKQTSAQTQDNTVTANPVSADPATALLAVCKQLKKIERAIAKYELAGVPMPNDVQF